jgi:H+/gluconate symporter-like permease
MKIQEETLTAFGALLLRNVTLASGALGILGSALANTNLNEIIVLYIVPAVLGVLLGSPS